jgi:hypothetical protein
VVQVVQVVTQLISNRNLVHHLGGEVVQVVTGGARRGSGAFFLDPVPAT